MRAEEFDSYCPCFRHLYFPEADQFIHIDLGLILESCTFVSIFIVDDGAATAAGDGGAFKPFLSIKPRPTDGNGKDGNVDGSNFVPSGRRVDVFEGGVASWGEMRLGVS